MEVTNLFEPVKKEASNNMVCLPNDLIEKMERLAHEKDISFNQVVVQCCKYAIDHSRII